MKPLKVAIATTIPTDILPAIAAAKTINTKNPNTLELCLRSGGDFRDFGTLDAFINFSKTAHVVIVHLMGDLPDFDKLVEALKPLKIPLMVSAPFFGGKDQTKFTTVQTEDKQKIFFYLNYGGKKTLKTSSTILQTGSQASTMNLKLQLNLSGKESTIQALILFLP